MDHNTLFKAISNYRVIVVEGARCTGKDYLIHEFTKSPYGKGYSVYEALKPRKQFLQTFTGGLRNLPAGLEIQQSHLWTLDVFRQIPDLKVIINRAMLSSLHFDGISLERFTFWQTLLQSIGGIVVHVDPSEKVHAQRIAKANRVSETESIYVEQIGIKKFAMQLPKDLVIHFSE